MFDRLRAWLRGDAEYADPDPMVREALRTGRREWPQPDGGTLTLLSTDEALRMTPSQRWAKHNAEAREAGCRCGRPGKLVRAHPTNGGQFEVYACDDHRDVTTWEGRMNADGSWTMVPGPRGGVS